MQNDLSDYRKTYQKSELLESNVPDSPFELFQKWFYETEKFGGIEEVNAMTVSTIGLDGYPKSRVVLMKKYTHEGFIFYTNYESEKGKAIAANPNVCLSFFWPTMERQVIVKGKAEKIAANLSDGYFESRPDGSKLGALASPQSKVIPSRAFLEENLKKLEQKYSNKEIPRPDYWGGFIVRPFSIEFWQGRPNRLHDRLLYEIENKIDWTYKRLAP